MTRSLPLLPAALIIFALSPTPAAADPISITVRSGAINVEYEGGQLDSEIDLRSTAGFRFDAVASSGHTPASCSPCIPGERLAMSAYVSTPYDGTLQFLGRRYTFDVNDGAGELNLIAPSFALPVSAFGTATFRSPFRLQGFLIPAFDEGASFTLAGAGTVTGRFNVNPFDAEFGGQQYQLASLRYDFGDSAPVPEPATVTLLATGLAAAFVRARRQRRTRESS